MTQKEEKPREEEEPPTEDRSVAPLPVEEVRGTMEATRQALERSAEEIERAKRLLREIDELVDLPSAPQSGDSKEADDAN
jgi:hypothetical protein